MLTTPDNLLFFHLLHDGLQDKLLHHLSRDGGEADQPVVPWVLLPALFERDQPQTPFLTESLPQSSVALLRRPLWFTCSFPLKDLWAYFDEVSIYSCIIESFICVSIFCLNLVNNKMSFSEIYPGFQGAIFTL